jgi:hypothetical protein
MLEQEPVRDPYAEIEAFSGGGSPETVEQGSFTTAPKNTLPDEEIKPTQKGVELGPGPIEVSDDQALDREAERLKEELKLLEMAPEQRYRKRLEMEGIPLEVAREVVDAVVVQLSQYRERAQVSRTISVDIQTRKAKDQAILANIVEARQPRYNMTFDHIVQVQNLAASLVRYGTKEFKHETEADLEELVEWLEDLPVPIFYLLVDKVRAFDRKIAFIFQEGYLENF